MRVANPDFHFQFTKLKCAAANDDSAEYFEELLAGASTILTNTSQRVAPYGSKSITPRHIGRGLIVSNFQ